MQTNSQNISYLSVQLSSASCFFRFFLNNFSFREKSRVLIISALNIALALQELVIAFLIGLMAVAFTSPENVLKNRYVLLFQETTSIYISKNHEILLIIIISTILFVIFFKNILLIYAQWQFATFAHTVNISIKMRMMRFFMRSPFLWFQKKGSSEALFAFYAGDAVLEICIHILNLMSNLSIFFILLLGLIWVAPFPSLILIISLGFSGGCFMLALRRKMNSMASNAFLMDRKKHDIQQVVTHSFREMRMTGSFAEILKSYEKSLQEYMKYKRAHMVLLRIPSAGIEFLGIGAMLFILLYFIFIKNLDVVFISGIMGIIAGTAWRSLPILNRVIENINGLSANFPHIKLLQSVFNDENVLADKLVPSLEDENISKGILSFKRTLCAEGITLKYKNSQSVALKNISFEIKKGSIVGLVGLSGAGKSSLVNVLTGLIPAQSGGIRIDGILLSQSNTQAWMQRIGYVPQSPFILNDTLAVNIALRDWGKIIDRKRVLDCCRMAALDFWDTLEHGIDTVLDERGTRLSGGQIQRIAIARALYGLPDLLIFDEATSALDAKSERAIHETILSLRSHVTVLIIAHRLSTVEDCDSLIWLDRGQIRLQGKPDVVLLEYRKEMQDVVQAETL